MSMYPKYIGITCMLYLMYCNVHSKIINNHFTHYPLTVHPSESKEKCHDKKIIKLIVGGVIQWEKCPVKVLVDQTNRANVCSQFVDCEHSTNEEHSQNACLLTKCSVASTRAEFLPGCSWFPQNQRRHVYCLWSISKQMCVLGTKIFTHRMECNCLNWWLMSFNLELLVCRHNDIIVVYIYKSWENLADRKTLMVELIAQIHTDFPRKSI